MKCILCGIETEGSTGAAGIRWKMICQPCKDREDQSLLRHVEMTTKVFNSEWWKQFRTNEDILDDEENEKGE